MRLNNGTCVSCCRIRYAYVWSSPAWAFPIRTGYNVTNLFDVVIRRFHYMNRTITSNFPHIWLHIVVYIVRVNQESIFEWLHCVISTSLSQFYLSSKLTLTYFSNTWWCTQIPTSYRSLLQFAQYSFVVGYFCEPLCTVPISIRMCRGLWFQSINLKEYVTLWWRSYTKLMKCGLKAMRIEFIT
jgi:hypothetical protein